MNIKLQELIQPMLGKPCCRKRVWRPRSLSFGFGEKPYHGNSKLVDDFYGEWEVGTYSSAWRVLQNKRIVCASNDTVDSVDELDGALKAVDFGRISSVEQPADLDLRLEFDAGIAVEFLAATSDDDECFHIVFRPGNMAIKFTVGAGWEIGESNKPWKGRSL